MNFLVVHGHSGQTTRNEQSPTQNSTIPNCAGSTTHAGQLMEPSKQHSEQHSDNQQLILCGLSRLRLLFIEYPVVLQPILTQYSFYYNTLDRLPHVATSRLNWHKSLWVTKPNEGIARNCSDSITLYLQQENHLVTGAEVESTGQLGTKRQGAL